MIVEVPTDGALNAFLKLQARFPTQLALQLGAVDGVAQVVPGAVGHIGNQVERIAFGVAEQAVDGLDDDLDNVDVLPLVEAAYVIGVRHPALVENEVDGAGMVFHIEPVAHVLALAIHREGLAMPNVVNEQRYQLFGELVRTVVVRTVGHDGRHAVGVVERPHKVVGRGFGSTVGAMRVVFGVFVKEVRAICQMVLGRRGGGGERRFDAFGMRQLQRAIDFVGRNVVEAFAFPVAVPILLGGLKEGQSAQDVGTGKGKGILDAAVHVAFGGQMNDPVDVVLPHEFEHAVEVANVGLDESVVRFVFHILQIGQITGIRELVEIDNAVVGIFVDKQTNHMRTDKPGTAGNENVTGECIHNVNVDIIFRIWVTQSIAESGTEKQPV